MDNSKTPITDVSLTEDLAIKGVRGGKTFPLKIKDELAERIRSCDLFFVAADVQAANEEWLQFETEKAAEYRRPVIFVSREWRRERWNRYSRELSEMDRPTARAALDSLEIIKAARNMLPNRLH